MVLAGILDSPVNRKNSMHMEVWWWLESHQTNTKPQTNKQNVSDTRNHVFQFLREWENCNQHGLDFVYISLIIGMVYNSGRVSLLSEIQKVIVIWKNSSSNVSVFCSCFWFPFFLFPRLMCQVNSLLSPLSKSVRLFLWYLLHFSIYNAANWLCRPLLSARQ